MISKRLKRNRRRLLPIIKEKNLKTLIQSINHAQQTKITPLDTETASYFGLNPIDSNKYLPIKGFIVKSDRPTFDKNIDAISMETIHFADQKETHFILDIGSQTLQEIQHPTFQLKDILLAHIEKSRTAGLPFPTHFEIFLINKKEHINRIEGLVDTWRKELGNYLNKVVEISPPVSISNRNNQKIEFDISIKNILKIDALKIGVLELESSGESKQLNFHDGKKDQVVYFKANNPKNLKDLPVTPTMVGIDPQSLNFSNRAVAASKLGALIFDENYPKATFAEYQIDGTNYAKGYIQPIENGYTIYDVKKSFPEDWKKLKTDAGFLYQLLDLQAFDYLIGHLNRSVENYEVDNNDNVFPINNDWTFPEKPTPDLSNLVGSNFPNFPNTYSDRFIKNIRIITTDWIKEHLVPILNNRQISFFKNRLTELKADMEEKKGLIIKPKPAINYLVK